MDETLQKICAAYAQAGLDQPTVPAWETCVLSCAGRSSASLIEGVVTASSMSLRAR